MYPTFWHSLIKSAFCQFCTCHSKSITSKSPLFVSTCVCDRDICSSNSHRTHPQQSEFSISLTPIHQFQLHDGLFGELECSTHCLLSALISYILLVCSHNPFGRRQIIPIRIPSRVAAFHINYNWHMRKYFPEDKAPPQTHARASLTPLYFPPMWRMYIQFCAYYVMRGVIHLQKAAASEKSGDNNNLSRLVHFSDFINIMLQENFCLPFFIVAVWFENLLILNVNYTWFSTNTKISSNYLINYRPVGTT